MDCVGLKEDIGRLKQDILTLKSNTKAIRENEEYSRELNETINIINSNRLDQILTKYLKDFEVNYPEILLTVKLGERIEIEDAEGEPAWIFAITPTNNGHVLIGGADGVLYDGTYGKDGKLIPGELIDIRDVNEYPASIRTITTTNDGHMLIGGDDGIFLRWHLRQEWKVNTWRTDRY